MGWSPELGAQPSIPSTGVPASAICERGPGTLVSTPTALLAKKFVRKTLMSSGEVATTRCTPKVTAASWDFLMRFTRRLISCSRCTGSSMSSGICSAMRAKWLPSSFGIEASNGFRLTGIIHITSGTEASCSSR